MEASVERRKAKNKNKGGEVRRDEVKKWLLQQFMSTSKMQSDASTDKRAFKQSAQEATKMI